MRGVAGFVVLSAGLGLGAYTYYPALFAGLPSPLTWFGGEPRISLAQAARPEGAPAASSAETARPRVFSPQSPLFAPVIVTETRANETPRPGAVKVVEAAPGGTVTGSIAPTAAAAAPVATSPVVTVAETPAQPVARPVSDWATSVTRNASAKGAGRGSSKPTDPDTREALVRDIQTQLKRVGCYDGEVDGSWGPGSKRAMTAFTERINATLPVEEPDYILLTLVQGHRSAACGETCPPGQSLSGDHCVANAVVASAARKARPAVDAVVAVAEPSPVKTAKPEIKAAPAVKHEPTANADREPATRPSSGQAVAATVAAAPVVASVGNSWAAETTPAPQRATRKTAGEVVARAEDVGDKPARPAAEPKAATVVAKAEPKTEPTRVVEPLPGRMTIGGPVPEQPKVENPVTSSSATDDDEQPVQKPRRKPHAVHAPKPVSAPAPRAVQAPPARARPAPPPRPRYTAAAPSSPSSSGSSAASRQRAMVYNLFQRPDRY